MTQYQSLIHEYLFKTYGIPLSTVSLSTYILLDIYKIFSFDTSEVCHIAVRLQSVFYLYGWEGLLEEEKRIRYEKSANND